MTPGEYRGRMAPSPTGHLHLGHVRTFAAAHDRARAAGGRVVLRVDDLDRDRVRAEFLEGNLSDLEWLGLDWDEGPDVGGDSGPYVQSARMDRYRHAMETLRHRGLVYPCRCSRSDIQRALSAPHAGEEEPVYPGTCRGARDWSPSPSERVCWRFRVPVGREVAFEDRLAGPRTFVAGRDFGDFVVWRPDDLPSYQLACALDDSAMGITEVVRGMDLLTSTARQWLLIEALGGCPPAYAHGPLVADSEGRRLAKRSEAVAIRTFRRRGVSPVEVLGLARTAPVMAAG